MISGGITVKLKDAEKVQARLNQLRTRANGAAKRVVMARALIIQKDLKQKLSQSGGGKQYRRGNKVHTASAPGSAPAVDTGRLRNSIAPFFFRGGLAAEVGTRLEPYPAFLEKGTGRMAPRPFLAPVWAENESAYITDMSTALNLLGKG